MCIGQRLSQRRRSIPFPLPPGEAQRSDIIEIYIQFRISTCNGIQATNEIIERSHPIHSLPIHTFPIQDDSVAQLTCLCSEHDSRQLRMDERARWSAYSPRMLLCSAGRMVEAREIGAGVSFCTIRNRLEKSMRRKHIFSPESRWLFLGDAVCEKFSTDVEIFDAASRARSRRKRMQNARHGRAITLFYALTRAARDRSSTPSMAHQGGCHTAPAVQRTERWRPMYKEFM